MPPGKPAQNVAGPRQANQKDRNRPKIPFQRCFAVKQNRQKSEYSDIPQEPTSTSFTRSWPHFNAFVHSPIRRSPQRFWSQKKCKISRQCRDTQTKRLVTAKQTKTPCGSQGNEALINLNFNQSLVFVLVLDSERQ